ncbi:MAG TPA: TonB-dependent receptor [Bryobacteraceae bacterium]|nr:TonB-dependent receptor [Bryobacteraceae bacterium]
MRVRGSALALVVFLFLGSATLLFSQATASITGTVTDASGAVVTGAQVKVTATATGQSRSLVTNSAGAYQAPDLQIGSYSVDISAPGFKTYSRTGIVLNVNDTVRVDAALQVGEATESVTVAADAVQVQADTNEQSNLITGKQVTQLAINGRNITQLTTLGTGASTNSGGFLVPSALLGGTTVSFNGQRAGHNVWLIDGGENYDRGGGGGVSTMPSPDAIAEFKALTSNFDPEYGQGSGGIMTMVIKSGTKDFHGGAWEFVRNDDFDANNYFANRNGTPKPKLRYNTFGYNLGGPIFIPRVYNKDRSRTFFFWNQEWRKIVQGTQTSQNPAFPQSFRNGDFSSLSTQLKNPAGGVYAGNIIPASDLDPNALAFLSTGAFPLPNASGNNYAAAPAVPTNVREEILKIDHRITDKITLMGSFIDDLTNQSVATTLWSGDTYPTIGTSIKSPSYAAVLHMTYTISPTVVNELAYNYNGNRIILNPTGIFKKPAGWNVPEFFSDNNDARLPVIQIGGNYGVNYDTGSWPWYNSFDSQQVRDDVSITRGNHNLKFGVSFMRTRKNQDIFGQTQGVFNFNGNVTGDAFADFLTGYANTYNELAIQDNVHIRNTTLGGYFADNWRATSRLTLNLGVRWEGVPHAYDVFNRLSNFVPTMYNYAQAPQFNADGTLNPNGPGFTKVPGIPLSNIPFYLNGVGISGLGGYPRSIVQNHWNNWGPRVGFALDLLGNGKTILRSGFGMFYERIQGNDVYNMGPNPPFSFSPTVNNVLLSNPNVNYLTGLTAGQPIGPAGFTSLAYSDYKLPTAMEWSFGIQQQLARSSVLSISYVGSSDYHQPDVRNINTVPLNDPNRRLIAAGTYANPNRDRIYPGFSDINETEAATGANYNSLQIGLRTDTGHGLVLQASYTWSHQLDYTSADLNALSNPFNRAQDYGSGDLDRRHILTFNYDYELPFFRHSDHLFVKSALGGWEISGITTFETGTPLTPNVSDSGKQLGLGGGNTTSRADITGPVQYPGTVNEWFNPSVFVQPQLLAFGNAARGSLVAPGLNNWNISLFKSFALGFREGAHLEFRGETFNTFNHTQFHDVNTSLGNQNFGKVTSVWDPRIIQLGLKLVF